MTGEYDKRGAPSDRAAEQGERFSWRRQAGFLGAVFAIAAAVIAAGLRFAPQVSAYSGLSPWVLVGLLGFVLVLAGACVLLAASLRTDSPPRRVDPPPPTGTSPDGSFPDGSFPDGTYPDGAVPYRQAAYGAPGAAPQATAPLGTAPAGPAADGTASPGPAAGRTPDRRNAGAAPAGRGLTVTGTLLGTIGLALAAIAVALAAVLPTPTETIAVQFTDLYGRVQLEYCPDLPGSFAGTAAHDDLVGSSTILPVKVTGEVCGNPDYTDGVWIYLNRASITISDRP